jgi:hypothetical protein
LGGTATVSSTVPMTITATAGAVSLGTITAGNTLGVTAAARSAKAAVP